MYGVIIYKLKGTSHTLLTIVPYSSDEEDSFKR